ncbi:hypothetical protein HJG60_009701 [Phyllostomus discolor]|uniref:RING-type E3 ubiquitin transferase n=1 Tax=Phyllostomus discolor TaxID=89673 RepID=A0A834BC15_9CHIR|nr:hypothetical protein HJG60_009701 [Phyllostomus discolor]
MASDFSPDCECSACLGRTHAESDGGPRSSQSDTDSSCSGSRRKSKPSSSMLCCPAHHGFPKPGTDNKKDSVCLSSDEGSYVGSSQDRLFSLSPGGMARKIRPLRELTVEELVREFGDNWKSQPDSMSVGHFRDQVVRAFRRALYYSGMWVTHVRGYRFVKPFLANYFKRNPGRLHRLVPWLKRELTAVYGDYGYTVKNILNNILHHMTEYDLDSESFIYLLEPYLHQYTYHFLHEFISFVHSPYNMETYDQRAIYQCPVSPWVKKKSMAFAPVLPLPKDQALLDSQHHTKESKNTPGQWNNEQRPLSSLKRFPNGNSSLKGSEIPLVHHKTASKIHAQSKDKPESGDHKGTTSTDPMLRNWAIPRERGSGLQICKQNVHERKTEVIKLLPGHVQDVGGGETAACTFSSPAVFHQEKQWKNSLREGKLLSPGQHMNVQKKEAEKNRCSDFSPKTSQRQLPRERSLLSCKSRKRDPSWSCILENVLSSERHGRKLSSSRKKRMACRQSSQLAEVGSHSSRRLQRQSRSSTRRSKSWCVEFTKGSVGRKSSNLSLRGNHRSECFTENIHCEPSKENKVRGYQSNHGRATVQYMQLPSTGGKKPKCPSKREGASQAKAIITVPHVHRLKNTDPQVKKRGSKTPQQLGTKTTTARVQINKPLRNSVTKRGMGTLLGK